MTRVGYVWVGPLEHNLEFQRDLLAKRGVDILYEDDELLVSHDLYEIVRAFSNIRPSA